MNPVAEFWMNASAINVSVESILVKCSLMEIAHLLISVHAERYYQTTLYGNW